ncbi:hypothetical protein D3874_21205 [Oleomonas cavernae]|uniref:Magnesium transporter n=1 Tax=Oleomonas cavernae TaxID=2320859 RepID=A0A418WGT2_9PROT|nr:CorA family divalent cation transporter [Oleomonas cavernae]RJF89182.1 hypothetical protein D3874_21205 [Oleomonas cavernae]
MDRLLHPDTTEPARRSVVAYAPVDGAVVALGLVPGTQKPDGLIWIDMVAPDDEDRRLVEEWTGIRLPSAQAMQNIAASQRFRRRGQSLLLVVPLLVADAMGHLSAKPTAFVLTADLLITVRDYEPNAFKQFADALIERDPGEIECAEDTLVGLLEAGVDHMADMIEAIGRELAPLSRRVFMASGNLVGHGRRLDLHLQAILRQIGKLGDKVAVGLYAIGWMDPLPEFLGEMSRHDFTPEHRRRIDLIDRDLAGLERTADHTFQRVQILLDATLGTITMRQSAINKVMSIVATIFLPPTLIGTVYGMNFNDMPELGWPWGYPVALLLMVATGVVPYLFIKWRGWF